MEKDQFLSMEDLADVFTQLKDVKEVTEKPTHEEIASQRRYEEIIKKHKHDNDQ